MFLKLGSYRIVVSILVQAVEGLLHCFVECDVISVPDGEYEIEVAKLTYNVLTYQNVKMHHSYK